MTSRSFAAHADPAHALLAQASRLAPENPFCTPEYAASERALGARAWLLVEERDGVPAAAVPAFVRTGRLHRSLSLPTLPAVAPDSPFWTELQQLCRRLGITRLTVQSYAAPATTIPALHPAERRRTRREYALRLDREEWGGGLSTNHRRNIRRGAAGGLTCQRSRAPEALITHCSLSAASFERRARRREAVPESATTAPLRALLDSGAGELHQAALDGRVLSSLLVLRSARGAYYHSAGTSEEGMRLGASHWLVHAIADALRGEGVAVFHLGGAADSAEGLRRFKEGFGTREVALEEVELATAGPLRHGLVLAARALDGAKRIASRTWRAPEPRTLTDDRPRSGR